MRSLEIDGVRIDDDSGCYVIAEIGQNHQGDLDIAKEMFHAAKYCGVNAVKLQKRDNRKLYTRQMYEAPYDNESSFGDTYGAHREALEFGREEYIELKRHAKELGLTFFCTAWDFPSVDFLAELDMPAYKIASGDIRSIPLLKYIAKIGKPMIMSTGGATMEDIRRAYEAITPINPQLCILQCTASYPAAIEDINLRVITTLREEFPDTVIGLSDHENGIDVALVAYLLGARVVEKHFTLHHASKGTDHAFSLEPIGMKKLVRNLRRIPEAMGDGIKSPLPCEEKPIYKMGKKLVAARDLHAGHVLGPDDIAMKVPGDGLPPYEFDNVVGKKLKTNLSEDDNIVFEVLE